MVWYWQSKSDVTNRRKCPGKWPISEVKVNIIALALTNSSRKSRREDVPQFSVPQLTMQIILWACVRFNYSTLPITAICNSPRQRTLLYILLQCSFKTWRCTLQEKLCLEMRPLSIWPGVLKDITLESGEATIFMKCLKV